PRSGVELIERIAERWRWISYRVRFHPFTTRELPRILEGLRDYARLMRLDRPIGIWLLLWPTLWALWISSRGKPNPRIFIIFVLGTVLMRSAGCAINDYADRSFDPHVARTKDRPLAAGRISALEALVLFAVLSLMALMLALQLDKPTLLLAVAGGFLAVSYPFVKRFLPVPQLYLGLAFGWGIPMAFEAQFDRIPQVAWLLLLANALWVTVYDTIYAMVDRDDDRKIGVRSTAILFGDSDRHIIAVLQIMTLLSLYLVGDKIHMGYWYDAGLLAGAVFFAYQLWLIRARDRDACFRAFLNNNYFGMAVFIGMALEYVFAR
ncbi:MAG TPA: 4-hydroxybenzoate octaprenyltransferase, partial [Steroidobacteraceae bacterium]|nr:4-hydroxybenzoate octaprenyltransferase [Steroidobacteraceae bacterium]